MNLDVCHVGDCRRTMRDLIRDGVKVQTVVTSPPYWGLRDYGAPGQFGLEASPVRYLARMRGVFRLVRELLADDGTVWLNMGDSYHSPRVGGSVGQNSTINGQGTQAAYRDAQRHRGRKQTSNSGSLTSLSNRRRGAGSSLGIKEKDLVGMPWLLALLLRADGWYLRQDIIWSKPAPMPESVRDRCTKSHEYLFLLAKSPRYYYDAAAIAEPSSANTHARLARHKPGQGSDRAHDGAKHMTPKPPGVNPKAMPPVAGWQHGPGSHSAVEHNRGDRSHRVRPRQNPDFSEAISGDVVAMRNRRSVWTIAAEPYSEAHFATFPRKLVEPCILAGSRPGDVVFDPFMGSGTTAAVAEALGRRWLGCELNAEYLDLQRARLRQACLPLS